MARVKVCGLTTPDALDAAAAADWIGFVFVPASPRAITPAHAARLSRDGPLGPGRVGLFVDPADDDVAAVLDALPLCALQLYAAPDRCRALRARFGVPVWQAVGIAGPDDLPTTPADRFLLDAKPPAGAAVPGGNARTFDWHILHGWSAPAPWMLAGGLTPDNVGDAVTRSGAKSVDASSSLERTRGIKDPALIRAFVAAGHAAA